MLLTAYFVILYNNQEANILGGKREKGQLSRWANKLCKYIQTFKGSGSFYRGPVQPNFSDLRGMTASLMQIGYKLLINLHE